MSYNASEKAEIIRIVSESRIGVRKTLKELNISPSTFNEWSHKFWQYGIEGFKDRRKGRTRIWNRIPEREQEKIVELSLEHTDLRSREISCLFTDREGYYVSESSVYRILKRRGLVPLPAYEVIAVKDKYEYQPDRINEQWQTDFTYFKIVDWGWYYLSTILDDYSRYIVSWRLCEGLTSEGAKATLEEALVKAGYQNRGNRPRLLSDNGSAYISGEFEDYLYRKGIVHVRGKPFHPQTQGKIERYHRSMKNVVLLDKYYSPSALEDRISEWVEFYNNRRYHESLNNVTPADRYFGREEGILKKRQEIKERTMELRRLEYRRSLQVERAGVK